MTIFVEVLDETNSFSFHSLHHLLPLISEKQEVDEDDGREKTFRKEEKKNMKRFSYRRLFFVLSRHYRCRICTERTFITITTDKIVTITQLCCRFYSSEEKENGNEK